MNLKKIIYTPSADVVLTGAEVMVLMEFAAGHSDHKCREAGQVGGFLYGLKSRLGESPSVAEVLTGTSLEFGEIDTLAKVTEAAQSGRSVVMDAARMRLHGQCKLLLRILAAQFQEANGHLPVTSRAVAQRVREEMHRPLAPGVTGETDYLVGVVQEAVKQTFALEGAPWPGL